MAMKPRLDDICCLDIEASGLDDGSYPIEIGVADCVSHARHSWLIKPTADWSSQGVWSRAAAFPYLNQEAINMSDFILKASVRNDLGKGASRRLRHAGKFPAVVYGGEEAAVAIVLNHDDIVNQMDKPEFYEGLVLVIDGKEVKVKPQDVQRHAFKPKVEHMDFIRI